MAYGSAKGRIFRGDIYAEDDPNQDTYIDWGNDFISFGVGGVKVLNVSASDTLVQVLGHVSASGNFTGSNFHAHGIISASSNITASGHVSASAFYGDGQYLKNVTGTPGGANTNIQFNNGGAFLGTNNFKWSDAAEILTVSGSISASSNISASSYYAKNNITASGHVSASAFDGDGQYLKNVGGGGTPGGSNTEVQFNDAGAFSGSSRLTYDKTTDTLSILSASAKSYVATGTLAGVWVSASSPGFGGGNIYGDVRIGSGTFGMAGWTGAGISLTDFGTPEFLVQGGAADLVLSASSGIYMTNNLQSSANITASGHVSASAFYGDGQYLKNVGGAGTVSTTTGGGNNTLFLPFVSSSTGVGSATLFTDGALGLKPQSGSLTLSGNGQTGVSGSFLGEFTTTSSYGSRVALKGANVGAGAGTEPYIQPVSSSYTVPAGFFGGGQPPSDVRINYETLEIVAPSGLSRGGDVSISGSGNLHISFTNPSGSGGWPFTPTWQSTMEFGSLETALYLTSSIAGDMISSPWSIINGADDDGGMYGGIDYESGGWFFSSGSNPNVTKFSSDLTGSWFGNFNFNDPGSASFFGGLIVHNVPLTSNVGAQIGGGSGNKLQVVVTSSFENIALFGGPAIFNNEAYFNNKITSNNNELMISGSGGGGMAVNITSSNNNNSLYTGGSALLGHRGFGNADIRLFAGGSGQAGTISGSNNLQLGASAQIKGNVIAEGNLNTTGGNISGSGALMIGGQSTLNGDVNIASNKTLGVYKISGSSGLVWTLPSTASQAVLWFESSGKDYMTIDTQGRNVIIGSNYADVNLNNTIVSGTLSASANISASAFYGDGSNLTNLPGGGGIFTTLGTGNAYTTSSIRVGSAGEPSASIYVSDTNTSSSLTVDKNHGDLAATTLTGLEIDFDKSGSSTSNNTMYGLNIDMDNTTATNGINTMYGLHVTPTLTHAANAGLASVYGAHIDAVAATNGSGNATAAYFKASGGFTNNGILINCEDGASNFDFRIRSSADNADHFTIQVGASGETTFETNDGGAAEAHLTCSVDGNIVLEPAGGKVKVDGNLHINQYIYHRGDADTYINFTDDDINITVGGINMVDFSEGGTDEITFNESAQQLDVRIEGEADPNLFFTDAVNNKVGIGTNSPQAKLHISSSVDGSLLLLDGAKTAPVLVVSGSGKIGVNTTSPKTSFDVHFTGSGNPINLGNDTGGGEVVYFGTSSVSGLQAGALYYLNAKGGWASASAAQTGSSPTSGGGQSQLLAISLGSNPSSDGMLTRGFVDAETYFVGDYATGSAVYVSTASAKFKSVAPTASNNYVRVIGYATTAPNVIYFNPASTYVEIA